MITVGVPSDLLTENPYNTHVNGTQHQFALIDGHRSNKIRSDSLVRRYGYFGGVVDEFCILTFCVFLCLSAPHPVLLSYVPLL